MKIRIAPAVGAAALLALTLAGGCSSGRPTTAASVPAGWPVDSDRVAVSSSFGARRGGSRHQGIDLAAPRGAPVVATADGVVVFAGRSGAFGRLVVIDHGGGWETHYAHLRRIKVEKGNKVRRGAKIGTVGSSGNATGDHLHYETRHNGVPVDPGPTLGAR